MPSSEPKSETLTAALRKISERVEHLIDGAEKPAQFVRDVHRQWKQDGGKVGGKPRHSERFLEDRLKEGRTPVKSLTPKLAGKTNIKARDGAILINFFLTSWPAKDGSDKSDPFLTEAEIGEVAEFIESGIKNHDRAVVPVASSAPPVESLPGEATLAVLLRLFEECDAMITVSPEHTLITPPKGELIGFRNLMNHFWSIEKRDRRRRPLIWVMDFGDQSFDDYSARKKFLNVQALMSRFKALKRFDERGYLERWKWLQAHVVIVLLDTHSSAFQDALDDGAGAGLGHNQPKRPNFIAHNISLSAPPADWLSDTAFRALYGRGLEQIDQQNYSVFFNAMADWPSTVELENDLRYFGYATFASDKGQGGHENRGLELPQLPGRNAEGFRAVCAAAAHVIGSSYQSSYGAMNGREAVRQLNYLGYSVLRLDEFMNNY